MGPTGGTLASCQVTALAGLDAREARYSDTPTVRSSPILAAPQRASRALMAQLAVTHITAYAGTAAERNSTQANRPDTPHTSTPRDCCGAASLLPSS